MNIPFNTGKVKIGREYVAPLRINPEWVSGPHRHHRSDAIVMRASVAALVCLLVMAKAGWI